MSDYTVKVNGLFPEVIEESKKVGKGLMEQVREGSHIPYEGLTQETLQRQLQTGQIDHITYLDLISQQE